MDQEKTLPDDVVESTKGDPCAVPAEARPVFAAPTSDQTNPHNQELAGDWVANSRAAERKNNEPGLTDEERKRRRW